MEVLLFLIVMFLAFSNGSNDNFKGVATLYGSGILSFRKAVIYATIFTSFGVLLALFFAQDMVKLFAGKGLVDDQATQSLPFISSVVFAAGGTVLLASKIGMPISTTHALLGGLIGAGLAYNYSEVHFEVLQNIFLLPLVLSPLFAIMVGYLLMEIRKRARLSPKAERSIHWVSGCLICAMRALNDAPKMAGMLVLVSFLEIETSLLCIGVSMALGGIFFSRKVAETLSKKLLHMTEAEGTQSSLSTVGILALANYFVLPVSTTHVNVGSIYGVSLSEKKGQTRVFLDILKSWVLTLPFSALLAYLTYLIIEQIAF